MWSSILTWTRQKFFEESFTKLTCSGAAPFVQMWLEAFLKTLTLVAMCIFFLQQSRFTLHSIHKSVLVSEKDSSLSYFRTWLTKMTDLCSHWICTESTQEPPSVMLLLMSTLSFSILSEGISNSVSEMEFLPCNEGDLIIRSHESWTCSPYLTAPILLRIVSACFSRTRKWKKLWRYPKSGLDLANLQPFNKYGHVWVWPETQCVLILDQWLSW